MLTTGHSHEKGDDEELHFDSKYLEMITLPSNHGLLIAAELKALAF